MIWWGQNDMSQPDLSVTPLDDLGDDRGSSFSVPDSWIAFLGSAHDLHLTTLRPGGVRGNHFHIVRREILVISYRDAWTLHWDRGESTPQESLRFEGVGAVLVEVDPYAAHAIVNEGIDDLLIVGITNGSFDPDSPDSVRRLLV